jgi:hypothetical protein
MNENLILNILNRILKEADCSKEIEEDEEKLEEFSGVGAVGGFTMPLGASAPDVGEPILKATKKKRRKNGR